jgi:hypothetical protein
MKFRIYHDKGVPLAGPFSNPVEIEAAYLEDAVAEVEKLTGGTAHDASAFIPELNGGIWIAVDIWTDAFDGQGG